MDMHTPENKAPPDPNLEAMLRQLAETQLALGKSISATSQFLRFVLSLANENLGTIRTQLEAIRTLTMEIEKQDHRSDQAS